MKQRRFDLINEEKGIEIMIDFGKENSNDLAVEVTSQMFPNNKRVVLRTKYMGAAVNWNYKRINEYLACMCDCRDFDEN